MTVLVGLAACHRSPAASERAGLEPAITASRSTPAGPPDDRVPCAKGDAPLERVCTAELAPSDRGTVVTVRHPDGAFRRLLILRDGRGVAAADGAEPARVAVVDPGTIEVRVGADRFRLPATVRGR